MRKLKYFMLTLLVGMVALTGCSKKNSMSPSEAVKKAVNNMQTSENYKMNMAMNLAFSMGENLSFDMKFSGDVVSDVKNGLVYTNMVVNMLGQDFTSETYSDTKSKEGKIIVYAKTSEDDEWVKSETDFSEDTNKMMEFFNNIKELASDKNNYNYEITITKEDFKQLYSLMSETETLAIADNLGEDLKIIVSIDKKTGNYSKISIDMKDLIKKSMGDAEGVKISKAEFVITVSDYNSANAISIPKEALEAETSDLIDYGELINSFSEDDYDKVLNCKINGENIESEISFGFNDDKYEKSLEETIRIFESSKEADDYWEKISDEDSNNQFVFAFDNKVTITKYHDANDTEKSYSISDVRAMMEKDGYVCE